MLTGRRLRRAVALSGAVAVAAAAPAGAVGDTTPPVVVVSGATGAWSNAPSVTVTASADDTESGVATVQNQTSTDGGATWNDGVGASVTVSAEGVTLVRFRATDNASNTSGWTSTVAGAGGSVRIDRTAPTAPGAAPDQIPGVLTWLDASDGSSVVTPVGAGVSQWTDRSGHGNSAGQATLANRPTLVASAQNGRSVVRFGAGGSQWMTLPSLTAGTVLLAGRKQAVSDANVILGAGAGTTSYLAFGTSSGLGNAIAQAGSGTALTLGGPENAWQILGGTNSATQITAWRNGAPGTPVANGGAAWTVDSLALNPTASYRLNGDVGEVVVFDRVLSSAERQLVEGYLAWRWGTQASLVSGHPYQSAAPGASGGSASWMTSSPRTVSVTGGSDGLSGVAGYEYRTSADTGSTWSPPQDGSSASVGAEGQTLVQFRAVDAAGNVSTWSPTPGTASATVKIDTVAPSVTVGGATGAWTNASTVTVTGTPSDSGSGVVATHYRTNWNSTGWTSPSSGTSATVVAEGTTEVQFRSTDAAGNIGAWTTVVPQGAGTVRVDRTAPAGAPTVSGATGSWSGAASATVTASGGSDAQSGVGGHQYRTSTDGGAGWSAPQAGSSVVITAEGETLVQFRVVDNAGNPGPWSTAIGGGAGSVRLDRTAPSVPATSGGSSSWSAASSVTVGASGSTDAGRGGVGYQYQTRLDNGAWGPVTAGATATVSAEGQTDVRFQAVDGLGNTSAWSAPETVKLDRTLPSVLVSGATGAWTSAAGVTVVGTPSDTGSGVAGTQFRTSTDGGNSWSSTVPATSVSVTDEGTTLVQFRATDNAGNTGAWTSASASGQGGVRIDRTAPAVTQSGADGQWRSAAARTVTVGASDDASGVAGTQYRVSTDDGNTWAPVVSGGSVVVGSEGTTLVQFRATDVAGNTSGWTPASVTGQGAVRLDRTSPVVAVTGADGVWTNASSVTATASATDGGAGVTAYESRTSSDGGASWDAAQASDTAIVTREGVTLVQFRATDAAGNTSPWSMAGAGGVGGVRIDRTAPDVVVAGADGSWSNAASVTVSATASDGASGTAAVAHSTSLDGGGSWSPAAPGDTLAITGEGETLVRFQATDAAGNTSAWTAAAPGGAGSVRLDRAAPGAPLMIVSADTAVPANSSRGAAVLDLGRAPGDTRSVRVVVTRGGRLVHDGAFGTVRDEGLSDSSTYTYQAVAYDRLGNASAVNQATITTPDRTPPAQPIAPDGTGWPMALTWSPAAGATAFRVLRDGVTIATVAAPSFADPGARDLAGPVAPGSLASEATAEGALVRWMPAADRGTTYRYQVVATDAAGNTTASPEATLEVIAGGVTYEVAVDGSPVDAPVGTAAAAPLGATRSAAVPLPAGMHEVTVTAVDAAGNRSPAARLTARGPDPGPAVLTARASDAFVKPAQPVTFTAAAPSGSTVTWHFPDGKSLTGTTVRRAFGAGSATVQVTARLRDGQELATQLTVVVDGSVPTLEARQTGRRVRVVPQDDTGLASLTAQVDRGRVTALSSDLSVAVPEGRHTVRIVAIDAVGNQRTLAVKAIVDTRGPTVTARTSTRPGAAAGQVQWSARDGASGVGGVVVGDGPRRGARGSAPAPAGRVSVLVATDRYGNTTRLAAPVPAPIRLTNLYDPGLQGKGDRLLPGGGVLTGIRGVVLTEAFSRLVWAGVLPETARAPGRYDGRVTAAVRAFQSRRHVREPAGRGALGPATLRAMDRLARWGGWGASAGRG